jgi:hypothetical protein
MGSDYGISGVRALAGAVQSGSALCHNGVAESIPGMGPTELGTSVLRNKEFNLPIGSEMVM